MGREYIPNGEAGREGTNKQYVPMKHIVKVEYILLTNQPSFDAHI